MERKSKYTKEYLEPFVKEAVSWQSLLRLIGRKTTGGNYSHIQARVRLLGIDTSHFKGKLWSKGLTKEDHPSLKSAGLKTRIPNEELFVENAVPFSGSRLTRRLVDDFGWQYKCSCCGINEWCGKPLTLHLDHINGVHNDNRFENLRFLCPNCHQQTDTWGNRKKEQQC